MPKKKIENTEREKNFVNETLRFPLNEAFEKDLAEQMKEDSSPLIIALIDLDYFLPINEKYGFDIGDKVLIDTGRYLKSMAPKGTVTYRVSGCSFAIPITNLPLPQPISKHNLLPGNNSCQCPCILSKSWSNKVLPRTASIAFSIQGFFLKRIFAPYTKGLQN